MLLLLNQKGNVKTAPRPVKRRKRMDQTAILTSVCFRLVRRAKIPETMYAPTLLMTAKKGITTKTINGWTNQSPLAITSTAIKSKPLKATSCF